MNNFLKRSIDTIERVGNRLPDPTTLFVIFIAIVLVISVITSAANVSVTLPALEEGQEGERVEAVNLLSSDNIQRILRDMPETFADFPPLGLVLVVMLGIGVADKTGLIGTALRAFVSSVPDWLLSAAVVFAGLMSSLAVDAGYVVLVPLGAVVFYGVGRHPIAGLAAAFAGVSAGFSSNLLLTSLDPLLASFTTPAAQLFDPDYHVDVTANYYMMIVLVPIFTILGAVITEKVVEPRLGNYEPEKGFEVEENKPLSYDEKRGLKWAGISVLFFLVVVAAMVIPTEGILRAEPGTYDTMVESIEPFLQSIVALMLFFFFIPGLVYGVVTRQIRDDKHVAKMTSDTMADMGAYIVLAFVAAHFIAFFDWSNLGVILAVSGSDFLQAIGFSGIPLIISFMIISALLNLFIGSASAKWAIMAPVFVPMLMNMGYSPELTQAVYRVGDSFTNVLTPLLPYFPLIIIFAQKYKKDIGIGTIIATMLPYSIAFGLAGMIVIIIWILFGIPLGPGAPMYY